MAEAVFSKKERDAARREKYVDLGDEKQWFIRKRNAKAEKEIAEIVARAEDLVRENRKIAKENEEREERGEKPKKLKEDPEPYEHIRIMLEDAEGNHPPAELLEDLDQQDVRALLSLVYPDTAEAEEGPAGKKSGSNGSTSEPGDS